MQWQPTGARYHHLSTLGRLHCHHLYRPRFSGWDQRDQIDTDVVAAEANHDWNVVFTLTSQQITAQYPSNEFANLLNQQTESAGTITAISEPLNSPTIQYTPDGQAYFVVAQQITLVHNGSTSTQTLSSTICWKTVGGYSGLAAESTWPESQVTSGRGVWLWELWRQLWRPPARFAPWPPALSAPSAPW